MSRLLVSLAFRLSVFVTVFAYVLGLGWGLRWLLNALLWRYILVVAAALGGAAALFAGWLFDAPLGSRRDRVFWMVFFPAAVMTAPFLALEEWLERLRRPKTVDQAVDRLLDNLDRQSVQRLRDMNEDDLALLHFDLGMGIRNSFGLWTGNKQLLRDCGNDNAHIASGIILARLLERVRRGQIGQEGMA